MNAKPLSATQSEGCVSGPQPERYIALSKVKEIVERIMDESGKLTADSEDYRLGQWSGADKVGFAIDCYVSTRMSETAEPSELAAIAAQLERAYGDLPKDRAPGPPTSIVKRLRELSVPSAIGRIEELEAEVARCHARLEIDHYFRCKDGGLGLERVEIPYAERGKIPDGIACRDETIKMLEGRDEP